MNTTTLVTPDELTDPELIELERRRAGIRPAAPNASELGKLIPWVLGFAALVVFAPLLGLRRR